MIDQNTKQSEIPILKDFDENCLIWVGVNARGVHKTIAYRIFFEDKSNTDVENSVISQILQAHITAKG